MRGKTGYRRPKKRRATRMLADSLTTLGTKIAYRTKILPDRREDRRERYDGLCAVAKAMLRRQRFPDNRVDVVAPSVDPLTAKTYLMVVQRGRKINEMESIVDELALGINTKKDEPDGRA